MSPSSGEAGIPFKRLAACACVGEVTEPPVEEGFFRADDVIAGAGTGPESNLIVRGCDR
jgi:hypothetical protein